MDNYLGLDIQLFNEALETQDETAKEAISFYIDRKDPVGEDIGSVNALRETHECVKRRLVGDKEQRTFIIQEILEPTYIKHYAAITKLCGFEH